MDSSAEFDQLPLRLGDQTQWRYEVIRPLVLFADRTAAQRAHETATHPETVRTLHRRFRAQGIRGLLPGDVEVVRRSRAGPVPDEVREEIDRLKALYSGFHYRELARLVFGKCAYPLDDKTAKILWQQSPVPTQQQLELWTYHTYPGRYEARRHVVQLYYQGWDKLSIRRFLQVSRPTVDTWIARFEAEHKEPPRQVWLPRMVPVSHLQKAHPEAGELRLWSLLAQPDISVRTVGRLMALNKLWWSILILEGYARTILAGAMAPTEATGATLMVLYTACVRYGAPTYLVSDSGGA